jgi:hypothetical protein
MTTTNSQPDALTRSNAAPAPVTRAQKPEMLPPPVVQEVPPQTSTGMPYPAVGAPASPAPATAGYVGTGGEALSGWERWKQRMQAKCVGYLEEFGAPPLGHYVYLHGRAQVESGEAARMVLYHYDFEEDGARLTVRGRDQLAKIEHLLSGNFFPVIIERTPTAPALADARRMMVLQVLAHGQFPVPPERVVIGLPPTPGLRGVEAELIYANQLGVTRSSGAPLPRSQDVSGTLLNITPQAFPQQ